MQQERHLKDPNITCPHCKNKYPMDDIESHYKECISGGWKLKKCPTCKKKFPKEEIWDHQEVCAAGVPKEKKEEENYAAKAEDDSKPATGQAYHAAPSTCTVCQMEFSSWNKMSYHRRRTHFWGVFNCPQCHWKENFVRDIIEHMREKDHMADPSFKCPMCKEKYPLTDAEPHYQECVFKADGKNSVCTTCGKTFSKSVHYYRHLKVHLRAQGVSEADAKTVLYYYCDRCGKRFTQRIAMVNHIKSVHEGIKSTATCPVCLLTFESKSKMRKHKVSEHPTDDKNKCQYCGKHFIGTKALNVHLRRHEEPQFKCNYCGKMLKTENTLAIHEREHTGERPFNCSICGNGYKSSSVLGTHMKHVHKLMSPGMKPIEKRVRKNKDLL